MELMAWARMRGQYTSGWHTESLLFSLAFRRFGTGCGGVSAFGNGLLGNQPELGQDLLLERSLGSP